MNKAGAPGQSQAPRDRSVPVDLIGQGVARVLDPQGINARDNPAITEGASCGGDNDGRDLAAGRLGELQVHVAQRATDGRQRVGPESARFQLSAVPIAGLHGDGHVFQIADALMEELNPMGSACVIEATHTCMTIRGAKKPGSLMVTSALRGIFKENPASRAEIISLMHG